MGTITTLWLLRHGQSEWNRVGRWQGQADVALSEMGRQQAHRAGERLRRFGITHIYSSDARRALETAQIVGAHLGLTPTPRADLRESDIGQWAGLTTSEIKQRFPDEWAAMQARREVRRGGGETYGELRARTFAIAQQIVARHAGEQILLVSHGAAIRAMISQALGFDLHTMHSLWIGSNTALSCLRHDGAVYFLDRHNDTSHIEAAHDRT